ncbi:hypothetical protein HN371_18205 [Candidatus Poribacteria bacterium]|nr:hypothetical protein [Candidatus Poribacteria bacterium]MBT5534700.1 hypothetical protein [Candidatus Poribacteria bacterium]MBT5711664.1 hypothetical protein [Candidatus Poribacteria bacterium]MBT7809359.1 hypothetical protein [Candidatus Poribacteria bacterium]
METDSGLCVARWLGRSLESFSHTNRHLAAVDMSVGGRLVGVLRLDTRALHSAVDDKRRSRSESWSGLADELGVGRSQLTRLSAGGRIEVRLLLTILEWLGRDAESFTRIADR